MRLLLVNANTSQVVTRIVARAARAASSTGTVIVPVTAAFGVPVIQSLADHAVAHRACLDVVARNAGDWDAALIAVSLDTAVEELRLRYPQPVIGMTAAALAAAREIGRAVGVLTIGETMKTLFLERFGDQDVDVTLVHAVDLGPAGALADRRRAATLLAQGAGELARRGAKAAVPMGATVAGLAPLIRPAAAIPVLDGIECGVRLAERLVQQAQIVPT